ncbi:MAG: phosphomethylpyrimidine synthase [candidate division Zixibacteria bacterium SM23_73_3]|nr:MAG: phosphomethylpyrimidine synthase [candidate division Zixibacteria bacterium SM23_73_3]
MIMTDKEIQKVAQEEGLDSAFVRKGVEEGTIVILKNRLHKCAKPVGVGKGLKTKINVNLGTSPDRVNFDLELKKLKLSIQLGADTVMDLSTGGEIKDLRQEILKESKIPVGTVPIYEAVCRLAQNGKSLVEMTRDSLFSVIEDHLKSGVDFLTVHCGLTRRVLPIIDEKKRTTGIVSRGGSFLYRWMRHNRKENPLYESYDDLLDMTKEYNATLSLGDGLRPGSIADSTDRTQVEELLILGELVDRAKNKGVQAMVEGPGHIPIHEIEANVLLEKKLCQGAPFYVLGPLVIDCAPGYDHIVSAIGGAVAGSAGADFLCYVTPSEHLGLPDLEDVREGIIASKIAAHAADIAKGVAKAKDQDNLISQARKKFDWDRMISLSLDPERARKKRGEVGSDSRKCTMCGEFCAMRENII